MVAGTIALAAFKEMKKRFQRDHNLSDAELDELEKEEQDAAAFTYGKEEKKKKEDLKETNKNTRKFVK